MTAPAKADLGLCCKATYPGYCKRPAKIMIGAKGYCTQHARSVYGVGR